MKIPTNKRKLSAINKAVPKIMWLNQWEDKVSAMHTYFMLQCLGKSTRVQLKLIT